MTGGEGMRLREVWQRGKALLETAGIPDVNFELGLLFEHTFCYNRVDLLEKGEEEAGEAACGAFFAAVERRRGGYPLQYILGEWEFYGLPFFVGEGVLAPRADTERLVEICLERMAGREEPRVLELCSGSGCIAVALEKHLPGGEIRAVEKSERAYGYLLRNLARHGSQVKPVLADALDYEPPGEYDLIAANPPYVGEGERGLLSAETAYEPPEALFAGEDGLLFYRALTARYVPALRAGGVLAYEIGYAQGEAVTEILREAGLEDIRVEKDYGGNDRVVSGKKQDGGKALSACEGE